MDTFFVKTLIDEFGLYSIIIPLLITLAIFNFPKFVDSTTYFKARKIKYMNEALESNWIDSDSKKILSESISMMYFSSALNIKVDKRKVKEILKIYDALDQSFNTIEIYHALRYLPIFFYDLPLNELKKGRDKVKRNLKSENLMIILNTITFSICSMYFIYSISINYQKDLSFIVSYLLDDFVFIICFIVSGYGIAYYYPRLEKIRNAVYILNYYIAISE